MVQTTGPPVKILSLLGGNFKGNRRKGVDKVANAKIQIPNKDQEAKFQSSSVKQVSNVKYQMPSAK